MRAVVVVLVVLLTGCRGETSTGTPASSPVPSPPGEWVGRVNPLPEDPASIARGRALFLVSCAPCHGTEADGKGVAARGLEPPPANFRAGKRLSSKADDVVFWRISTGIPGTAMPAFSGTLSEEERWAILRFLRSLPGGRFDEPGQHPEQM